MKQLYLTSITQQVQNCGDFFKRYVNLTWWPKSAKGSGSWRNKYQKVLLICLLMIFPSTAMLQAKNLAWRSFSVAKLPYASTWTHTRQVFALDSGRQSLTARQKAYGAEALPITISGGFVPKSAAIRLTASMPAGLKAVRPIIIRITPRAAFPSPGYVVNGAVVTNFFEITIPFNANSVSFIVQTFDFGPSSSQSFSLEGNASDGGFNEFKVVPATLVVMDAPVPEEAKVFVNSSSVSGGETAQIQATLKKARDKDLTVYITPDSPGFPTSYSMTGIGPFSILIKAGSLYGATTVRTATDSRRYDYVLRGYASDGGIKPLSVSPGTLSVLETRDLNKLVALSSKKVMEGTSIDITASLPNSSHPDLEMIVTPSPNFPSNYRVKVNGQYQGNPNGFWIKIPNGKASAVFTVETADDGLGSTQSFSLNGASISGGYAANSANLVVIDKRLTPPVTVSLKTLGSSACKGTPINLGDMIEQVSAEGNVGNYQRFYRYEGETMQPITDKTTVNLPGSYTIYAINQTTGEVGTAKLKTSMNQPPAVSTQMRIGYYWPFEVDLTDPSVISSSNNVDHYNYYSDKAGSIVLAKPNAITNPGVYYIQGVSPNGCLSELQPITVFNGGPLKLQISAMPAILKEGDSGYFRVSMVNANNQPVRLQKAIPIAFNQDNNAQEGNYKVGHCKIDGNTTLPFTVRLQGGSEYMDLPVEALTDRVLYNNELLVLKASNNDLGQASSAINIVDQSINDPHNLVVTVGEGVIYRSGSASVAVSLPVGVTTAKPLTITLVQALDSKLGEAPIPTFPTQVVIPAGANQGEFIVNGSNNSEITTALKLEGTLAGYKVQPGTIAVLNKRIQEFMSVSANGDQIHDYSQISNIEKYPDNEVDIVDRWGVLVWRGKGYNNRDLAFSGKSNLDRKHAYELPEGTYYYVIRFYDETGELNISKGDMQLKRGISE